ncbi:HAMP domain-containing protein [Marinobacterium sp. D7]|uniref:ATP-binding protein n=1 Tax=Marinobacterium ramblicola TaxID=2849041 RepID=UPI001C2CDC86|nr:ATP-binding protein [Marinobacterium ramblicola]MBV1787487.1 HAMP domain-containing protein [Marinobacterium ramblicola]
MLRYLRQSLPGRVIGLLILALGVVNATTVYVFFEERGRAVRLSQMEDLVSRSAAMDRLLDETPLAMRSEVLGAVTSERFQFSIGDSATADPYNRAALDHPLYQRLRELADADAAHAQLSISPRYYWCYSWVQNLLKPNLLFDPGEAALPIASLSILRPDGQWLNATLRSPSSLPGWIAPLLVALALFSLTVTVVVLIVRHVSAPLGCLSKAADRIGRGELNEPIPEYGSEDVIRTTRAFNRMQERLQRFVGDRTRMMAAISHDLRTPLTTLRLHAEFIEPADRRDKVLCILGQMQEMLEATLTFTREASVEEERRTVDLSALIGSICEDLRDLGQEIEYDESQRVPYLCRPGSVRRALTNLIENACKYGGQAEVELSVRGDSLQIAVRDRGPGIPEADQLRVFDPFVRLETSRSRETGGIGLGLSIARTIAHSHGGEIRLSNRAEGGLEVVLELPNH